MLSIGVLVDAEYPIAALARSAEEYYLGHGEAAGRWTAAAEAVFGLSGEVDEDVFRALIEGRDPTTGEMLAAANRKNAGYDLCFRAPKSVSVLFGLGDPDTARIVGECHDDAVDAALGYLERSVTWTRKGRNGVRHVHTGGLVVAAFRHRTSREADPHLHTHAVAANLTRSGDGKWGTLHSQLFWAHAKTAGCLYEAELRMRLTQRLGVEWGPVINGIADLAAVPEELLDLFSKRSKQIKAQLDELGFTSPRAAEIAALDTRRAKSPGTATVSLRDLWRTEATDASGDPAALDRVAGIGREALTLSAAEVEAVHQFLESPDGLTGKASTFDRRKVITALTDYLPEGAPVETVEAWADEFLARPAIVSLPTVSDGSDPAVAGDAKAGVYSTRDLLALERRMVAGAVSRRHDTVGLVDETHLADALRARPTLADEQAALVAGLTTSGSGVEIVSAAAGTGKTFCLDAAREAWEKAGHRVVGCALAARAAAQLEDSASIPSSTLARLLGDLDRSGGFAPNTVVVCDEAAMVDSRTLARLLDHAERGGAKVVLVGDEKQLHEIGPGGAFRGLTRRLGAFTLEQNRRQLHEWERTALTELRSGDVEVALAAYAKQGRVVTAATAPDVRDRLVADWWAAGLAGEQALMIAARWADVDDLNHRARSRMLAADQLHGPELEAGERVFQVGDRVLALRNDKRRGLTNGSLGTVTDLDPAERRIRVRLDTGDMATVTPKYLDAGHLAHGYATTAHKAQGLTCDRALLLGNDSLYRELGYVGMSRGRLGNHLYVVDPDRDDTAARPRGDRRDPLELVADALRRSTAQTLAIDTDVVAQNDKSRNTADLADLLVERRRLDRILAAAPPDPAIEHEALTERRHLALGEVQTADQQLEMIGPLRLRERVGRTDPARVVAENRVERAHAALQRIDRALAHLDEQQVVFAAFEERHRAELDRRQELDRLIDAKLSVHLGQIGRQPPAYLTRVLGPIPDRKEAAAWWWREVAKIETYRIEAGVTATDTALGAHPDDPDLAADYQRVLQDARFAGRELAPQRERSLGLGR